MRFKDFVTEAPKGPVNDRVQLINDLLHETESAYKMKLEPHMLDEALDEVVKIMSRVVRGADDNAINDSLAQLSAAMKNTRKAILPFPTWDKNLQEAGVWIDNEKAGRMLAMLQANQLDIMSTTFFLANLHELFLALNGLHRLYIGGAGHDGRMGTSSAEQSFLRAGFKKLRIME